jgi:hypothetical protein
VQWAAPTEADPVVREVDPPHPEWHLRARSLALNRQLAGSIFGAR